MSPQELRRRLRAVDPNLTIISAHSRPNGHKATMKDWEMAAGVVCSNCHKEVFRSRDGICFPCWEKAHEIEVRDKCGALNFFPQTILERITHKAKKSD